MIGFRAPLPVLGISTTEAAPADLPYQGGAYQYGSSGGTGSIAGGTAQASPDQSSPIGSVSGGTVLPGPDQNSPTGSVSGGTILAPGVIYD